MTDAPFLPMNPKTRFPRTLWKNRSVVITAGPTREPIDPVRFLSNASSGEMGWALARCAQKNGARVTLIAGPTTLADPRGVHTVRVITARDMDAATRRAARLADVVIGAAAVADWRPTRVAVRKIKKGRAAPVIRLVKNPDILKSLARQQRDGRPRLAGFALETENVLKNAARKMREKKLSLIVANTPRSIGGKTTTAWLLRPGRPPVPFRGTKQNLADRVLALLGETL